MPVSNLEDKMIWQKRPNSPPMQHSLHLLNKHKCSALFKTFKYIKKRMLISPHQLLLHLPLCPLFCPTGHGCFPRVGACTILVPATGSSVRFVDNSSPEEMIFSRAFIFTKRKTIYINVNTKARIETEYILIYLITSLW